MKDGPLLNAVSESERLDTSRQACPSPHRLGNKVGRVLWGICWWTVFRPTPRPLFIWRAFVLRLFGADVSLKSRVDPTARIWVPWNLSLGDDTSVGHHADLYNVAPIRLGNNVTVSQYSYLCAASHDVSDPNMSLTKKPIEVGDGAWICAKAFVGPGVRIGSGAVVGACGVVVSDVSDWSIVAGNPAREIRQRELRQDSTA